MADIIGLPISEAKLHAIVAEWLDLALVDPEAWWSSFPAGGGGLIRGAQLKSRGLKPGVPDILIVYRSNVYFIELKTKTGKLSQAQIDCHDDLTAAGARIATCRCLPDVAMAFRRWSIPYRVLA